MIVIGYQAIRKATLANKKVGYIDLESGNFWVDGVRAPDWYRPYCQIAEDLSKQGYTVFTSSHEVVRKQLENSSEDVVIVCPDVSLKEQWIEKLENRYQKSGLDKDYKAYMNALCRYEENIMELQESTIPNITIQDINYNLRDLLEYYSMRDWEEVKV